MADVSQNLVADDSGKSSYDKALADATRQIVQMRNEIEKLRQASKRTSDDVVKDFTRQKQAMSYAMDRAPAGNPWSSAFAQSQRLATQGANPWISASRGAQQATTAIAASNSQQLISNGLMDEAAGKLAALAGAYGGLRLYVQAYNYDLQQQIALQAEAAKTQKSLAGAQAAMAQNTLTRTEFGFGVGQVAQIQRATGFPDKTLLTQSMYTAISAADTKEQGAEAVRIAASLARHNPDLLDTLAGAGLDIATSAGVSPEEGIALSLSAGKTARVADPARAARNISQAVAGMTAARSPTGDRRTAALEAAQLMAAMNKVSKDPRGERSRTAAQQLADHLDEFFEQGDVRTVAGRQIRIRPPTDPGTVGGRFELLGRDAKLRKQFFDKYNFEAGFENIITQMMTPGSEQRRVLEETRRPGPFQVSYDPATVRTVEGLITGGTPELTQATARAAGEGAIDVAKGSLTRAGATDTLRKWRNEAFAMGAPYATPTIMPRGLGFYERFLNKSINEPIAWGQGNQAEMYLNQIRLTRSQMGASTSPEERVVAKALEELIANGEKQLVELRKITTPKPVAAGAPSERGGQSEK